MLALLALLALPARPGSAADPRRVAVGLYRISSGLASPTAIAAPNDGSNRYFVTEQPGRVRVRVTNVGVLSKPYLDITSRVTSGGERGLLGMVFHPNFRSNGLFYVSYTNGQGALRISRFASTPRYNEVRAATEVVLLEVPHPNFGNHNGGMLAFGPDGYLYISTGDGGSANDPNGNGQNVNTLLGKILRIDVNRTCSPTRYCIPSTNPWASVAGRRKEIWHYGLRNPWRFSFDRSTLQMYIADVGQGSREEVDVAAAGAKAINWGWDCREGTQTTNFGAPACRGRTFTPPVREYDHGGGRCSITGGYVYRGSAYASLLGGIYLHADYCSGQVWGMSKASNGSWIVSQVATHSGNITSFGESPSGELFVVDGGGSLYRITATAR
jgi:glucose/arabinose dehydrogenase